MSRPWLVVRPAESAGDAVGKLLLLNVVEDEDLLDDQG
jgi:hypothetical protein